MSFMDKFQSAIERLLVPLATKLNAQRHICAVRDAFILSFPLTMAGSLMVLLNNVFLSADGFMFKILQFDKLFPGIVKFQAVFAPVVKGSADIFSILIVFLIARNLAKLMEGDDLLTGLTAISVYFIIYPDYFDNEGVNYLTNQYLGAQGLFVAILVGLLVGELMSRLAKSDKLEIKMPEQVPSAVARSFKVLIPIIITTIFFSVLNYFVKMAAPGGLHELIYNILQTPLTRMSQSLFSVLILALLSQSLWAMGIHGPNTIAAIRDTMFSEAGNANLLDYAKSGTTWGAPFPITYSGLATAFSEYGGSGMTLGLIIAILIFSKNKESKSIAKLSLAPGLFNINEMVIFGLPIVLNPIYIIPFIIAPLVNIMIGYTAVMILKIMPPVTIGIPWTTPGPLMPFLGTGGNIVALFVGFICLAVSVLIYSPFVIAANKAAIIEDEMENEIQS
ncbi:PTS system, lactose/cellobiose family IIC component [Enterococcus faecalis ATCC 35038]|uniref:PTS sugar transporter subunit IIC n=1 Tax=Enterococcus faecalis TaxID=1351 RepID=UPI00032DA44E|nr:PTS transporter subunit EIIC [Enterococcus faecalis]EGO7953937.1 PTS sugar transporter subunit IIC [Enterococcus faecalis]EHZ5136378.1 PTS sugar transporter subunit IIC [Enterococcus faecalis]EIR3903265.1 PTS sugar transporter subunit IIC [Enterococcus faecalis]EOJ52715.1 PTS system, lactose/cellobiose family IIC component [Enterococcus faecalis ATCC 35038]PLA94844.1 PTS sugar transporter subunit IIC [Enterococcus faecalis]